MINVESNQGIDCDVDKINIVDINLNKAELQKYLFEGWEHMCHVYSHEKKLHYKKKNKNVIQKQGFGSDDDVMGDRSGHLETPEKRDHPYEKLDHYMKECILEMIGSLRKVILHRLFCNIAFKGDDNKQCNNEYVAMGSTNITSDYDLTVKGTNANEIMWEMFKQFIELYNVTLPHAFDTNLYSSPLHLLTGPQCDNNPLTINKALEPFYITYDKKNTNFTFIPTTPAAADVELNFAMLKLLEADEEKHFPNDFKKNFNKWIEGAKKLQRDDVKTDGIKALNKALNKALFKNEITEEEVDEYIKEKKLTYLYDALKNKSLEDKKTIMNYHKQYIAQKEVQEIVYNNNKTLKENQQLDTYVLQNSNEANYWASEAYYTSSAVNTIVIETQMYKGTPIMYEKYVEKKISPDIIKKIYLTSMIENFADMIHHIDNHLKDKPTNEDVMLTLIKFSKYLYRFYFSYEVPMHKGDKKKMVESTNLNNNLIPRRKDGDKEKAKPLISKYFDYTWEETKSSEQIEIGTIMEKIRTNCYALMIKLYNSIGKTSTSQGTPTLSQGSPSSRKNVDVIAEEGRKRREEAEEKRKQKGKSWKGGKKRTKKKARKKKRRKRSKRRRK